jgi:hypothetical protein
MIRGVNACTYIIIIRWFYLSSYCDLIQLCNIYMFLNVLMYFQDFFFVFNLGRQKTSF